ncbi:MAG TPA: efflux RND transporter periplasmic adaptor subunit [Longimicrobiales bacterium]|nr:efflux RND transporter periplasmic adaptor subunit [Longimicrobiales bacterium]
MKQASVRSIVAAASLAVVVGCGADIEEDTGPSRLTATVQRGDLIIRAEATGTVEPVRKVDVKSKASGEILRLHTDVGDAVSRGALLAEIDPRDVRNNFNQVQADLEVARARLEISEAQLERSQQLLEASVITQQEHENARLDYTNAQASLVRADTNFELAQLQLMDVSIRAPMDGTIIQKNVEEGVVIQSASQNVSGGTTLFVMADLGDMQVRTLVDETDVGMLEAGLEAGVTVEAFPDRTFRGVIEKIEPQAVVEQNVTMFPVIVALDNRSGLLKPGMNAEVVIQIDEARDVLLVQNNAIVQTQNVGPAALALGLDLESVDLTQFMQAGGARFARSGDGGRGGAPGGGQRNGGFGAGQRPGGGGFGRGELGAEARERFQELRAQVESGDVSPDSMRAAMSALGGRGALGGDGAPTGSAAMARPERETRPAAVFVVGPGGVPEPRLVQMGIGDWDNTEIVSGVDEGDELVIVGPAQLQAQQEEFLERMRGRMGGSNPFGGGVPGGGRGFRGR